MRSGGQLRGDVDRVGDDLQPRHRREHARDLGGGGATAERHRHDTVGHERGRRFGDPPLLLLVATAAIAHGQLVEHADRHRASVGAAEQMLVFEELEVTAHRRERHAQIGGQLGDHDRAVDVQPVEDDPEAVLLPHRYSSSFTTTRSASRAGFGGGRLAVGAAGAPYRRRAGRDGDAQRVAQLRAVLQSGDESGVERVARTDGVDHAAAVGRGRVECRAQHPMRPWAFVDGERAGRSALDHDYRSVRGKGPRGLRVEWPRSENRTRARPLRCSFGSR